MEDKYIMTEIRKTVNTNREYKDRLFRLRFGSDEYKEDMLCLYNAVNRTSYTNPADITITTIDDVIYIKMKNDVSLIIDGNISLWEHQSLSPVSKFTNNTLSFTTFVSIRSPLMTSYNFTSSNPDS